jgi:hypothetical protein
VSTRWFLSPSYSLSLLIGQRHITFAEPCSPPVNTAVNDGENFSCGMKGLRITAQLQSLLALQPKIINANKQKRLITRRHLPQSLTLRLTRVCVRATIKLPESVRGPHVGLNRLSAIRTVIRTKVAIDVRPINVFVDGWPKLHAIVKCITLGEKPSDCNGHGY